jgi:hypothetical protein
MLDEFDLDMPEETPEPEESDNRTFLLVAGGLGGLMLLTVICMAVYVIFFRDTAGTAARETENAEILAQNTEVARALTLTAEALTYTDTPTATLEATDTQEPTATSVLVTESDATEVWETDQARTMTIEPALTQAALAQTEAAYTAEAGIFTPTPTGLADTGIMDDFGVAGLVALSGLLVLVIIFSRRLRTAAG